VKRSISTKKSLNTTTDFRWKMPITSVIERSAYGRLLRILQGTELELSGRLPRVVVVGDENQGKSSTIERIAGRAVFPRGNGFTTRVPIKLALRRALCITPYIKLRHYRAPSFAVLARGDLKQLELLSEEECSFVSREETAQVIAETMAGIVSRVGSEVVDNELIEVEIAEPDAPDLDLIDLPGIVGAPHELFESTRRLSSEFIKQPNTLVVCVVSAAQPSLRSSQALGLVTHLGALDRSITAMTQIDLAADLDWQASRLMGESSDTRGLDASLICCVRNRDSRRRCSGNAPPQVCEDESLAMSDEIERAWFRKRFTSLGDQSVRTRLGLGALLKRVNELMEKHIRDTWINDELQRLRRLISETTKALEDMGMAPELLDIAEAARKFATIFHDALSTRSDLGIDIEGIFTRVDGLVNPLAPQDPPFPATAPRGKTLLEYAWDTSDREIREGALRRAGALYAFIDHIYNSPEYVEGVERRLLDVVHKILAAGDDSEMKLSRFARLLTMALINAANIDLKSIACAGAECAKWSGVHSEYMSNTAVGRLAVPYRGEPYDEVVQQSTWAKATSVNVLLPMAVVSPEDMVPNLPKRFRETDEAEAMRKDLEAKIKRFREAEIVLLTLVQPSGESTP